MVLECLICTETHPAKAMVRLGCTHYHCKRCLAAAFQISLDSEPFIPVRCCSSVPTLVLRNLVQPGDAGTINHTAMAVYREKLSEHAAPLSQRLYCWRSTCRAFIPVLLCDKRGGMCRKCKAKTCKACKGKWHTGVCDALKVAVRPVIDAEARLLQLATQLGWKRCPNCNNMVEKNHGCNHIRCRCGCDFCYRCGRAPYGNHGVCAM